MDAKTHLEASQQGSMETVAMEAGRADIEWEMGSMTARSTWKYGLVETRTWKKEHGSMETTAILEA